MVVLYELVQLDETGRVCGPLLELHVVLDGLHSVDVVRKPDRTVDIVARAREPAQLNDALER
jgi:hypothetical protein